ncbi:MAG: GNAT family N-acetyltransferase [Syntrophomonadaceae bacterium]|nr:GNAT family N-acetyltransferase [Syntrophomonadaceae bacterium]
MDIEVRRIGSEGELSNSVNVLRNSFATVAAKYNLTRENTPSNAAFIEYDDLLKPYAKGIGLFGVYKDKIQIGFFSIEKNEGGLYYLGKLAVVPDLRHNGYGQQILEFVFNEVKQAGGGIISIGIINANLVLKNWYIKFGFTPTAIKNYPHLPFAVCMMEKVIKINDF